MSEGEKILKETARAFDVALTEYAKGIRAKIANDARRDDKVTLTLSEIVDLQATAVESIADSLRKVVQE